MYEIPQGREQTEYFALGGGLVETVSSLNVPPGSLMDVLNYEPSINGGYRRMSGYERFDGRTRPSEASYTAVACTLTSTPAAGDLITTGAITSRFVKTVTGGCLVTLASGTIPASTSMTVGGSPVGTTSNPSALVYTPDSETEAKNQNAAADVARTLITVPTGSGQIRGVVMFKGTVYCFRNNAGGTAVDMWKSTSSGWSQITLNEEVTFSNANTSVGVGDTLTQGSTTSTIRKVIVQTGTLASGVNTGKLVISGRNSPNVYAAGAATSTGGGSLTLGGAQTAQAFTAGGTYEFAISNFSGSTDTTYLYGVNGVGKAFEFDGTYVTFIDSGWSPDTPEHICINRNQLFLSLKSSVVNSSIGDPHRFVSSEGAAETAIGADVTGMIAMQGEALGIATAGSVKALVGFSASDWSLLTVSPEGGANAYTLQNLDATYCMESMGITKVRPVQEYGNFAAATESDAIQWTIAGYRSRSVCSVVNRTHALYRVFMNNFEVLVGLPGKKMSFTKLRLDHQATCAWGGEDNSGNERIFFGATDGMVYEMDRGSSFDGGEIESRLKLWFNHSRGPRINKRYKRAVFECTSAVFSRINVLGDLTFDDGTVNETTSQSVSIPGSGGVWGGMSWSGTVGIFDAGIFDAGIFDMSWRSAQTVAQPVVDITGNGLNLSLYISSDVDWDFGHAIQGIVLHYTPRRTER